MALQDMPLSDLQSAVSLNGTDLFYVVQSGESKKVTLAVMIGNKADLENGLVPLRELPNSVVLVANDTERFALDSDEVNNGFIVLQYDSTHPEIAAKMFLVIDNTNLDSEAGYQPFAADAIWGNIINRPTNLAYLAGDDEELPSVSPVLRESSLQNNLVTTLPNYPLDARQGKVLDDKITTVNQNLTNNTISTSGLSPSSGITIQSGGYTEIGNLVVVNIRFKFSANFSANTAVISGFKPPVTQVSTYINAITNVNTSMALTTQGELVTSSAVSSGATYIVSFVYIKS